MFFNKFLSTFFKLFIILEYKSNIKTKLLHKELKTILISPPNRIIECNVFSLLVECGELMEMSGSPYNGHLVSTVETVQYN